MKKNTKKNTIKIAWVKELFCGEMVDRIKLKDSDWKRLSIPKERQGFAIFPHNKEWYLMFYGKSYKIDFSHTLEG